MAKKKERKYILDNFDRDPLAGDLVNRPLSGHVRPGGDWAGHCVVATPFEAHTKINFTGPVGACSSIYYSLVFQLGKWEYNGVEKADEWIEVSPVHAAYYQLTMKQKEELEGRIKAGLASVSQAVADYELLLHDKRKYEEMLHYLGYESRDFSDPDEPETQIDFEKHDEDKKGKNGENKNVDNHSLKAMFIDQVDMHTGDGISMRSIVQRWPTLISDFMRLDDEDTDPDKVKTKLDVSRAEAVILVTKNKLYLEWKKIFLPDVVMRYRRILELVRSRKKSVNEYKEWLKPFIARHKLIKEGLADKSNREYMATSPYSTSGHPVSSQKIVLWIWKDFTPPEIYKAPSEINEKNPINPYDDWTKKNLIFNEEHGLIVNHPWIDDEWCEKQLESFRADDKRWLPKPKLYYSFFIITFERYVFRTPQGEEFEDGTFDINLATMSANAMYVKLLELMAKRAEFDHYVNTMLGIPDKIGGGKRPKLKGRDAWDNPISKAFDKINVNLTFLKRGPYERDFDDRITKYYLAPIAGERYVPIVNFIKSRVGYGQ